MPSCRGSCRSWRRLLLFGGLLSVVLLAGAPDVALAGAPDRVLPAPQLKIMPDYVPGEVIVLLSAENGRKGAAATGKPLEGVENALRGQIVRRSKISAAKEVVKVKLPPGKAVETALAEKWSQSDSRVVAVEPNYRVHVELAPNDPQYAQMWGLNNTGQTGGTPDADIDAPEAWNITTGSPNVIVCVIDTGVDYLHPDLAPNMWHNPGEIAGNGIDDDGNGYIDDIYGWDFVQNDNDPSDAAGHGSHVSGTIAARGNNSLGVTGVNWQCKIMACRFLDASGSGDTYDAIDCVNYAVTNGARILSNSWGGGGYLASMEAAIVNARNNGVLFVAAAGNNYGVNNDVTPHYPSNYPVDNIISVASTTDTDALSSFSNYGPTTVHLGAPGSSILSSVPPLVPLFVEDFQGAAVPGFAGTQMTLQGPANRWGTVNDAVEVGNKAARGDLTSSPYQSGSDGSIVTPVLNTTGLRGLSVFCLIRIDSGEGDTITIDATSNGTTWTTLASLTNLEGFFLPDVYYAIQVDVPENLRGPTTRFRWRWTTDAVDNGFVGVEIDDIVIQYIGSDYSNAYSVYSGTSMATPHVSGVAALMLAKDPSLTYAQLKNKIVNFGDPIPALAGKTVSGRRLNANTALNPTPPIADDVSASTGVDTPTLVTLVAHDDGLPTPPAMTYIVTALPAHGSLADPNGATITSVPYSLLNHGAQVRYTPASGYAGTDSFAYKANDGGTAPTGGDSNVASVDITVISIIYAANMDSNPGWTLDSGWAWGTPTGNGSSGLDPTSGHTGTQVIGYNLNGAYENNMGSPRYATTPAIDCTGHSNIHLRFWRWLGVESASYDHAAIQVSINGTSWTTVWDHTGSSLNDTSWQYMEYTLPSIVNNQPTVYLRWSMGPTDYSVTYQGWNIDDVEVVGERDNRTPFYTENLNTNPGWTVSGEWAFGAPTGQGGTLHGFPDPTSGATGANVYGVNLNGDYTVAVGSPYYLTTSAIDCGAQTNVKLQFQRWLNVDWGGYVAATVEVSANGNSWTTIYANDPDDPTTEQAWQSLSYDISAVADHCATLYIRWGYQVLLADAYAYSGWNIDDIVLSGEPSCTPPATPADPTPQNGATDVPVDTNLSWGGGSSGTSVVINEVDTGDSDIVELYNPTSAAVDLTGWSLIASDDNGIDVTILTLPTFTLNAGAYVVLHETAGTNTATDLYFNVNIYWDSYVPGSASLVNAAASGVDFVRWSDETGSLPSTDTPPAGTNWTGPDPLGPSSLGTHNLGRNPAGTDTDSGTDWHACTKTPGGPNSAAATATSAATPTADNDADLVAGGRGLDSVPAKLRVVVNSITGMQNKAAYTLVPQTGGANGLNTAGEPAGQPGLVPVSTTDAPADVLVYTGNGGYNPGFPDLIAALNAVGKTTLITSTFPASLSGFRTVYLPINTATFDATQTAALRAYVYGGGVLVACGEFAGYSTVTNDVMNALAAGLSSTMSITSADIDLGCRTTTNIGTHALTAGVTSLTFAAASQLNVGAGTLLVSSAPSNVPILGAENLGSGQFVLATDVNLFATGNCTLLPGNLKLIQNLASGSEACVVTYDVYLGTTNPPTTLVAGNLTATTFDPGGLLGSTTYYWKVVARDCCGQASSPVWSFTTTGTCLPPPMPANPDPADGATEVPPISLLSWNGTNGYLETFDDGLAQGWQEITDAQWSVVANEYRAQTGTVDLPMQSLYTALAVQDCYAQVTARRTGNTYSVSGLVMRASPDFNVVTNTGSAYLLGISADGSFYVARLNAGTPTWFTNGWVTSNLLNRDLAANTIGMSIQGGSIKAYINGSLAWSGTDTGITGPGYVGLYGYSGVAPVAVHYYDNVLIGQPLDVNTNVSAVQAWYNEHAVPGSIEMAPAGQMPQPPAELLQLARPQVYTVPEAKKDVQPQAISSEAPTGSGGPDAGGYVFIDSDTPGGPAFNWIDIRSTGTQMPLTDDSFYFPIDLPFAFNFYGTGYNQVAVASNGTIYFENAYLGFGNTPIPGNTGYGVNKYIAVYWDDLDPSSGGDVRYQVIGTAPNRILVVQWQNVPHCCGTADGVTMQAQLYEGSGHILMLYADASSEVGSGATVGIQGDTTTGLQYLYNQPVLHGELAVLFTRGVTYDLYLWSGDPAAQPTTPTASCLLTPSYDPGFMQCAEPNYWRVVAKSPCGQTPGPRWTFNVFHRPGDANADGHVDVVDLLSLVYAFGTCSGDPGFDATCDFNTDGCVDSVDLLTILYNWDQ